MHLVVGDLYECVAGEGIVQCDDLLLQRGGTGYYLEHGAGVIKLGNGLILPLLAPGFQLDLLILL